MLVFSRRTWYILLVISAALSMSAGFGALVGINLSMLNVAAFGIMGLSVLFLAAEKDNDAKIRTNYFQSFLLGMLGYVMAGAIGLVGACLTWPMLLYTETKRGSALSRQLRLLILAEGVYAMFWLLATSGMEGIYFFVNLFAVFKAVARGWAAYALCRAEQSNQEG